MGKKSPSVPAAPDPVATAQAQAQANKEALQESARLNSVNLYGPSGSVTYGFNADGTPHSQYTQLTPQGQWLYDAQQGIAGQLMQQAYNRTQQIPTNAFSLANTPYDPNGYNTSAYGVFNPVSTGINGQVYGSGGNQAAGFFAPQQGSYGGKGAAGNGAQLPTPATGTSNGQDFLQNYNFNSSPTQEQGMAAAQNYMAGKNGPQQQPQYQGQQYQQSPGMTGGQNVNIDNKWFPDSSVYATQPGTPGQSQAPQPAFPGTQGYTPPTAPKPAAQPKAAWKYGDMLTPDMINRATPQNFYKQLGANNTYYDKEAYKNQSVTGTGLDAFQKYGKDQATFDAFMSKDNKDPAVWALKNAFNIKNPTDLLYVQNYGRDPSTIRPNTGGAFGAVNANPYGTIQYYTNPNDAGRVANYRLDHATPTTQPAAAAKPATPQATSSMPGFPGQQQQQQQLPFDAQQVMSAKGSQYGAPPPPNGSAAMFGNQGAAGGASGQQITSQPQTTSPGQIPAAYPTQNLNVLPYDPRSYGDINMYVNDVQNAVFDQQMNNLRPAFDQQYDKQVQQLQDRGLPVGGEAYNKALSEINRNRDSAYQQAANQAIAAGGQEADRRLGMEQGLRGTAWTEALGAHQQQNSDIQARLQIEQNLRNQSIQDQLLQRNQAFNEASAFLQGSPALNMPTAPNIPTYQMQAPDVIGSTMGAYNAQMQAYQAKAAAAGSAWQGAAGIVGGLGSMKCSRTYKTDDAPAERILDAVKRVPVRSWRYVREIDPRQELHIGPYAEDWKRELGLGDGKEISVIDVCGVLMKCVQELSTEVDQLKNKSKRRSLSKRRAPAKKRARR